MVLRFANGMQGMISGAQGVRYGYDARCEVLGSRGILFSGSLEAAPVTRCTAEGMTTPVIQSWRDLFAEAYRAEDEDFVNAIREDRPPKVTGRDGRAAVTVVNAGNESIRTGKPVRIP
jgi:myo-inositol 2-dehydrogenase/D-chiro-inositol 1-dehydrogenase/scyllo-inositol 2-dehydrogenase (NAD+)